MKIANDKLFHCDWCKLSKIAMMHAGFEKTTQKTQVRSPYAKDADS